ncbi:unnamed protein product [Rodentolepis nana]|uniref:DDA1 domain-containing protein n=1 Tax=Rodentolepis nana TaxID=102285 RepID=A0A0R3TJ30_RODNA|nr:unnamed protein product [Rodentolepis nana]
MMRNPDQYLHNLHNLPPETQSVIRQYCLRRVQEKQRSVNAGNGEEVGSTGSQVGRDTGGKEPLQSLRQDPQQELRKEIEKKKPLKEGKQDKNANGKDGKHEGNKDRN